MPRSLLTLVVGTCLTLLAPAAPAAAEGVIIPDERGDLFNENIGDIDPSATDPDALRVRVAHRHKVLVVTARFVAFTPEERHEAYVWIDTSPRKDGYDFRASGVATATGQQRVRLASFPDLGRVRCPGMSVSFNHDDLLLKITIPRTCLDLPRQVDLDAAVYRLVRVSEDYTYGVNEFLGPTGWLRAG